MASLARVGPALQQIQRVSRWSAITVSTRSKSFSVKDFKPGPYPETEAERRAAAKKYNMIYEDYEPYHKDGFKPLEYPLGDYPKLEPYGEFSRDPHADYDFKSFKRNWGEPVHPFFDIYTSARWDVSTKPRIPYGTMHLTLLAIVTFLVGGYFLFEYYDIRLILVKVPSKRQYPYQGKVHYTFEPAE